MSYLTAEQVVAAQKAQIETLFGLTHKAFEGVEKVPRASSAHGMRRSRNTEKVHKECFAQHVDGAPSTAPSKLRPRDSRDSK